MFHYSLGSDKGWLQFAYCFVLTLLYICLGDLICGVCYIDMLTVIHFDP